MCCGRLSGISQGIYAIVENAEVEAQNTGQYKSQIFTYITKEVAEIEDNRVKKLRFYLADVEAFDEPIVVVPNIGGPGNSYLMMSPRLQWAEDFGKWLEKKHEIFESLVSDEEDVGAINNDSEEATTENEDSDDDSEESEEESASSETDNDVESEEETVQSSADSDESEEDSGALDKESADSEAGEEARSEEENDESDEE